MTNKRRKIREYNDIIYNHPKTGKLLRDSRTITTQVKNTTLNHIHELSALFQAQRRNLRSFKSLAKTFDCSSLQSLSIFFISPLSTYTITSLDQNLSLLLFCCLSRLLSLSLHIIKLRFQGQRNDSKTGAIYVQSGEPRLSRGEHEERVSRETRPCAPLSRVLCSAPLKYNTHSAGRIKISLFFLSIPKILCKAF